uniref:GHMP kinase C-terminal domain-containing protein n=1 Tax=Setaria italica TaxID=4555 RepID=K3Z133_SETIT
MRRRRRLPLPRRHRHRHPRPHPAPRHRLHRLRHLPVPPPPRRPPLQGPAPQLRRGRRHRRAPRPRRPLPTPSPSTSLRACPSAPASAPPRPPPQPPPKAVDALFGSRLSRDDLVLAGLESEKAVSGFHADNIAPAILGGFVLVRSYDPFHLVPLASPPALRLHFVLVTPDFEAPTSKMRAALPKDVLVQHHVRNSSQAAALVAAVLQGDAGLIGSAMSSDAIVEPTRAPLIPGMAAVKAAALQAGALGCTISGAGPTAVAVIDGEDKGEEVARRMVDAFWSAGNLKATATVAQLDRLGARVISTAALH